MSGPENRFRSRVAILVARARELSDASDEQAAMLVIAAADILSGEGRDAADEYFALRLVLEARGLLNRESDAQAKKNAPEITRYERKKKKTVMVID